MSAQVVIVGGGIGGLTLGIALRRAGVPVEIYERAEELREVGAAVALSANGTRVLYRLGIGDGLDAVSTQPTELIYRDGVTAERVAAHPGGASYRARFGAPYWGIHRVNLQQGLATAFGDEHLHLGSGVASVAGNDSGAEITLDDGSTVTADVVIGADGVHSVVRDHVAGPGSGPVYSGTSAFRGLVPVGALPSLPDPLAIQFWMGPDAHLLHYALGADDDTVNFFAVLCGPREWGGVAGPHEASEGELLRGFEGWHPAVTEMLAAVPQSPRWPLLTQPPLNRWTRGRVTLIGDACHAMLPHHGQGANQSIEDAAVLAELLATLDPDAALTEYPRRRRGRTRAVARIAWDTGTLLHLAAGAEAEVRDAGLAHYLDRFSWVHSHGRAAPVR
ncbi:MAG: FAD-dependent monooxygenase [Pseudonocardia sp.]|nr:FAD-dependent monooxygenase [Pseudonocardia sp.]